MECPPHADNSFGPQYCSSFDFTILFEQSFLQIVPCSIFLLALPVKAFQLHRQSIKTRQTLHRTIKQLVIAALAGLQLALLVVWSTSPNQRTDASVPASIVSLLAALALLALSSFEHSRSIRPSSTINLWILFSLVLDLPQARSLWLRTGELSSVLPILSTSSIVVKAIILYLEARSKRSSLYPALRLQAPEAFVNLYDRLVLWWLNPLFFRAYQHVIPFESLYPVDPDLASRQLEGRFKLQWERRKTTGKRALLWTITRTLSGNLGILIPLRLILSALTLSQPLLINRITAWLTAGPDQNDTSYLNTGRGLIGGTLLVYLGSAIANASCKRQLNRLSTQVRAILCSALYTKTLALSAEQLSDNSVLTLVSNDAQNAATQTQQLDELFANPIEITIATFLLARQIGVSSVAPVGWSIAITLLSFLGSNTAVPLQKKWLACISERVSYTSAVLSHPKGFKMLGLADYFANQIQALRVRELSEYAAFRKFSTLRNMLANIPEATAGAAALMTFTLLHGSGALSPTVAFTSLSLVYLLAVPVSKLVHAYPWLVTYLANLDRIQAFLLLEESKHGEALSTQSHLSQSSDLELQALVRLGPDAKNAPLIRLEHVSVDLGKDSKRVLHDISLMILPSSVTAIVGPVGCGKSTLLQTLIGEVPLVQGMRTIAGPIAYCAQDPWLPNTTVRQIVLGLRDRDDLWYSKVITACALAHDIVNLPQGHDTVIGTRGVTLSGGQRQRLALARALYSRAKVLCLDDPTSGLDNRTSSRVFDAVLGPNGLCQEHGIAVVLTTNARHYLPLADHILVLGSEGSVQEQGSFSNLDISNNDLRNMGIVNDRTHHHGEQEQAPDTIPKNVRPDKLAEAQQDLARQTGDFAVYAYYLRTIGWGYGLLIVSTAVAFAFFMRFSDIWVQWWSESSPNDRPLTLWISIYWGLGIVAIFSVSLHIYCMLVWTVPKSSGRLHKQLLLAALQAPYAFLVKHDTGVLLNHFSSDMSIIEQDLAGAVLQTVTGITLVIGSALLIALGSRYVGLTMPVLLVLLYGLQKFYLRTSRQLRFLDLESKAPLLTHFAETAAGITTIRAFAWGSHSHERCLDLLDRSQRPYYLLLCVQRWLNLVLDLVTAAMATILVALAVNLPGDSSAGSLGVSLLNIMGFNFRLSYLVTAWTAMETALGAVARCKNFESSTPSESLSSGVSDPSPEWPARGAISFNSLVASYSSTDAPVLKNITLDIHPGEKIGICGRTGSGKSSLLLTLFRMLDPHPSSTSSPLKIDNLPLSTIPPHLLRTRISSIPQEPLTIPSSTLRENLLPPAPLPIPPDADLILALKKVGLLQYLLPLQQASSALNSSSEETLLYTPLSTFSLTSGQTQLLSFARALLRKSPILLLDEFSSSLDTATERNLLVLLKEEFKDSTIIAVAHRLETIRDFDRVVVMERGEVVEVGEPGALLRLEGGSFREMWGSGRGGRTLSERV